MSLSKILSVPPSWRSAIVIALALALLAGCASSGASRAYRQGEQAAKRELWDHAVLSYAKAVSLDPGNSRYKLALARAKLRAATDHFERAKRYRASGQLDLAIEELQETVLLDPANQYALVELQNALKERERRFREPSAMERAQTEAARQAEELGPPKLDATSNIPLILNFPDSTVEEVYEAMAKPAGINILYDEKIDLKEDISVELANVSFEEALDILMLQNKHAFKVINSNTILIYEDQRAKRQEYEDHVIRTFYLSNSETKEITTLLRTLLETRRVADNQSLNAITLKDTPEKLRVAERIIKANDKARGEVIVDIELLEINRTRLQNLGIDLTSKSLSLVFGNEEGGARLPINNLDVLRSQSAWTIGPIPSVVINFLRSDSDTRSLSKPQLRILEGEKGKIHIGDRVPIPATSFNTSQTIGGNIVPVTSFTYQNIGIQLEVEPRVHHNKEITLTVSVEVSSLAGEVQGSGGVSQPIIGTRNVETTIRLKDGETNLLAGLVREEERTSMSGLPGVQDIPILRHIFGNTNEDNTETDIVLSLTPHIIRVPDIQPIDLVPLWVGTEEVIKLRGVARNALGESPFSGPSPWAEIEAELNGEEPGSVSGGAGRSADDQTVTSDDAERARERQPRQRRPRGEAEPEEAPEDLPPEGDFGADDDEPARTTVPQVRLAPSATQVRDGEPVTLEVLVSDATDLSAFNFHLRYDPQVLRFVPPAVSGEFLLQGGIPADLQATESAEGGLIMVSAARPSTAPVSGAGRLMRLNFVAVGTGQAGFDFSRVNVRDAKGQRVGSSFHTTRVEVGE